mmetsp:Transcript_17163/g.49019  ORF Transcript_17163/g.49019 Transcript_17163/m.49019 type:complete len:224 (+) Transcript_17163:1489-2160(+)
MGVQQLRHKVLGLLRNALPRCAGEVRRLAAADVLQACLRIVPKGQLAGKHDVQGDAATPEIRHGEDVGGAVAAPPHPPVVVEHFRGHIRQAAGHLPVVEARPSPAARAAVVAIQCAGQRPRQVRWPDARSDAKISELDRRELLVRVLEEKVFGLHVAVHDATLVAVRERAQHLVRQRACCGLVEVPLLVDLLVQVASVAQLHEQEHRVPVLVDLVQAHDVRVV